MHKYQNIIKRLHLKEPLPINSDWSAGPDFIKTIIDAVEANRPKTIVECSSGLTTLTLAQTCQRLEHGVVYSLENGGEYADKTRSSLLPYQLSHRAKVIDAPLMDYPLMERTFQWYSLNQLPKLEIEMLVIDGPPGFIQPLSRYPALPLLDKYLADGCKIFMDDAIRNDEQEILELWQQEFPAYKFEYLEHQRGCAIITVNK